MLLDLVALLAVGLFAAAALYVTLVEHPARRQCGAALAAMGGLARVADWSRGHGAFPLAAGLLMVALIAFTLIVILPTNTRLLDPALDPGSAEAAALLARWGRLHAVRSGLGTLALLLLGLHLVGAR